MPASPADSPIYRDLFSDDETAALFTSSAEIRAMMLVEGALARVQGQLGLIPETAAAYIDRAAREVQIDPSALAAETAVNGVPVPALIAAFRKAMEAPEHARYLHWGATSQDIMETGQALRLRRVISLWDARLEALARQLGHLALAHAELPMAARTYGQAATPTSFGAVVAGWGHPILRHSARLVAVQQDLCAVSLSGAAGTLAAMGAEGPQVRAGVAEALGLSDPGHGWHAERDRIGAFAAWMTGLIASLGKIGEDLLLMTQSGVAEVVICGAGASSTMPQKQNPVGPSVLVALARQVIGLNSLIQNAGLHRQQRDGAAWFTEWLTLPQMCILTGRALALTLDLSQRLRPDGDAMARGLDDGSGLIRAEEITFSLSRHMPRPEAQAKVKELCANAKPGGPSLAALVTEAFPTLGITVSGGLGTAPDDARAFARSVGAD